MSPLSVVKNNKIRNSLVANRSVFKLFLTEKYKQNPLIFDRVLHFLSESVLDWHDPSSLSLIETIIFHLPIGYISHPKRNF